MLYYFSDISNEIPLPYEVRTITPLVLGTIVPGIILDLLIIYSLLRQINTPIDSYLIISMTAADLFYTVVIVVNLSMNYEYNTWSVGKLGCVLEAGLIIYTMAISIFSITGLALYRYAVGVKEMRITKYHLKLFFGLIWIGLLIFISAFGIFLYRLSLFDKFLVIHPGFYCYLAMHLHEPINLIGTLIVISTIFTSLSIIFYSYYQIILQYKQAKKRQDKKKEQKLIKIAVGLTTPFFLFWICYGIKCLYEVGIQTQVPVWFDTILAVLGSLIPFTNAIILLKYDLKVRRIVNEIIPFYKLKFNFRYKKNPLEMPTFIPANPVADIQIKTGFETEKTGEKKYTDTIIIAKV